MGLQKFLESSLAPCTIPILSSLYANIDGFSFKEASISVEQRSELDRWILSELNRLIEEVDATYNDYELLRQLVQYQNLFKKS